jgi:hypothetical protein
MGNQSNLTTLAKRLRPLMKFAAQEVVDASPSVVYDHPQFVPWNLFDPDTLFIDTWYYSPAVTFDDHGDLHICSAYGSFKVPDNFTGDIMVSMLYWTDGPAGDDIVDLYNYVSVRGINNSDESYSGDGDLAELIHDGYIHTIYPVTIAVLPNDIVGLQADRSDYGHYTKDVYFLGWLVEYL